MNKICRFLQRATRQHNLPQFEYESTQQFLINGEKKCESEDKRRRRDLNFLACRYNELSQIFFFNCMTHTKKLSYRLPWSCLAKRNQDQSRLIWWKHWNEDCESAAWSAVKKKALTLGKRVESPLTQCLSFHVVCGLMPGKFQTR